jgi:hypothetical protein
MADAKPSDFFLGIIEFFAIVLPGAALIYLIQPWTARFVPPQLQPLDETARWIAFLVLAYVVGHVLHALAGKFDKSVYDSFYLRRAEPSHYDAVQLVKNKKLEALRENTKLSNTLYARALFRAGDDASGTHLYDWCLSFIRLQSPAAAAEVDRCQADSKFFRSLAVVMVAAAAVSAAGGSPIAAGVSFLVLLFSIWRFCALRWEATKRVYEFYLLLHQYLIPKGDSLKGDSER